MDEDRMVRILQEYGLDRMLVNSAADWGSSDPLKVAQDGDAMRAGGFTEDDVDRVVWRNPVEFYAQSGRLELGDRGGAGLAATFAGNSILRGGARRSESVRFRHPDGSTVHLAYCTNVHPAEDVDGIVAQLDRFAGPCAGARRRPASASASGSPAEAAARPRRRPPQALARCAPRWTRTGSRWSP